jgi:hypothetical protein
MNLIYIFSAALSIIGILMSIIALIISFKQSKRIGAIQTLDNDDKAINIFLSAEKTFINVMGVTRLDRKGKLLQFIKNNTQLPIKILLLNPYSVSAFKYIEREDYPVSEKNTIFDNSMDTIQHLKQLSTSRSNIEIRLYDDFPMGLVLFSDNYCLFEPYYLPESRNISFKQEPLFLIKSNTAEYNSLTDSFNHIWIKSEDTSIMDPKTASLKELSKIERQLTG